MMPSPQRVEDTDSALTIIDTIDNNNATSQREIAKEAGIAVGLANSYIKRFARKGLLKIVQDPANR